MTAKDSNGWEEKEGRRKEGRSGRLTGGGRLAGRRWWWQQRHRWSRQTETDETDGNAISNSVFRRKVMMLCYAPLGDAMRWDALKFDTEREAK